MCLAASSTTHFVYFFHLSDLSSYGNLKGKYRANTILLERETVFIVGTVEDKGRCSSHPPRTSKGSKKSPSPPRTSEDREQDPGLVLANPLQPAWYDQVFVSHSGTTQRLEIVALNTPLGAVTRGSRMHESETVFLSIPPYRPVDIGGVGFELHSQGLSHTSPEKDDSDSSLPGSTVLFLLFEHNSSLASSNLEWSNPIAQHSHIEQLGPRRFQTFPSHHFFARVYRPHAITAAILNRQGIFCAEPEWTTLPFELHHKCAFDRLLDLLARAPALLQRLDQLLVMDPTLARRLAAQDLLGNCLNLQSQLEQWLAAAHNYTQPLYWISTQEHGEIPFTETFSFQNSLDSLSMLYYWSVQVLMRPCLEMLIHTIFSPVLDTYPQVYPDLPPQLNINPASYSPRVVREYAANVCRGLDYALQTTTQPDMVAFPVQVVENYYGGLNIQVGDGALELMWLGDFRGRMAMRGQALACAVTGRGWTDLAAW